MMTTDRLNQALAAIDLANSADPRMDEGQPEALLYGQRMSTECDRLFPDADEMLRIAARGQHIERWIIKRSEYPEGRVGYLNWRRDLAEHHAMRIAQIMREAAYGDEAIEKVGRMLRKQGIKRELDVQALEDVICFTFLKWYFAPFAAKHPAEKVQNIVKKTARKMSQPARERVIQEFDLPEELADAFRQ